MHLVATEVSRSRLSPTKRVQVLVQAVHVAQSATHRVLAQARVLEQPAVYGVDTGQPVHDALLHERRAEDRLRSHLEQRVLTLERQLRSLLASDACADVEGRASAFEALYGQGGAQKDHRALSGSECRLVMRYRSLAGPDRSMVRTLLDRLVAIGESDSQQKVGR